MKATVDTDILFYALRYALGRQTYAVGTVVEELIANWEVIPLQHKVKMQEEIRTAINKDQAGAEMDVKEWKKILTMDSEGDPEDLKGWEENLADWEKRLIEDRAALADSDFIEHSPRIKRAKWNIKRAKQKIEDLKNA